jgi:DNA-binding CsgD family transcriptional regulator
MFALIGDLVGSRSVPDRAAVHDALVTALDAANELVEAEQPLEPTVGDEFQGAYARLSDAGLAALVVRLHLLPVVDARAGIGLGEAETFDATRVPRVQDGPAWWAAREALEHLGRPRSAGLRTWYVGEGASAENAYLLARDALVDRLNERSHRMLALALAGRTQREVAEAEGVSPSAVSQAFARGIAAVRDAEELRRDGRRDVGGAR